MALVEISKNEYIDTDDLEQAEYYYFCRAKAIGKQGWAHKILTGGLSAFTIENSGTKYRDIIDDVAYDRAKAEYDKKHK